MPDLYRSIAVTETAADLASAASDLESDLIAEVWRVDPRLTHLERLAVAPRSDGAAALLQIAAQDTVVAHLVSGSGPRVFDGDRDFRPGDVERVPSARVAYGVPLHERAGRPPSAVLVVWSPRARADSPELQSRLAVLGRRMVEAQRSSALRKTLEARVVIANAYRGSDSVTGLARTLVDSAFPQIFGTFAASIFLVNEACDRLNLAVSTGLENLRKEQTTWYVPGEGMTGLVWSSKRTLLIRPEAWDSGRNEFLRAEGSIGRLPPPKSREELPDGVRPQLLVVPIVHEEEVVGVVRLCGRQDNVGFSDEDELRAEHLSADLGVSLVRRQVADRDRQHGHTLTLLGEELQQETDEQTALRLLLAAVTCGKGLAFNRAAIWLQDTGQSKLEPALLVGHRDGRAAHQVWETIGDLTLEEVLKRARHRIAEDPPYPPFLEAEVPLSGPGMQGVLGRCVASEELAGRLDRRMLSADNPGDRALIAMFQPSTFTVVPIRGAKGNLGVLYADNIFDRKPIGGAVVDMLRKLARVGGLAVERIREEHWRAERAETHEGLTRAIVGGPNPKPRVETVLDHLQLRFRFERWLLYHHDPKTGIVNILGNKGFDDKLTPLLTFDVGVAMDAVTPQVVRDKTHHFTLHAESDEKIAPYWRETLQLKGPLLVYPLPAGGNVYGVLVINDPDLTEAHIDRLRHFDNDLAIAVTVEMLDRQLRQRDNVLDLIESTQTAFVHAFADEPWFLHELAFRIKNITGSSLCAIYRTSPRGTPDRPLYARVVALGYPNVEDDDTREPAMGDGLGLTSHVLAGQSVRVPLVARDPRWLGKQKAAIERTMGSHRSFLGVPLRNRLAGTRGGTVGAITLTRARLSESDGLAFQESDAALVDAVATAVSSYLTLKDAWRELDTQLAALKGLRDFSQRLVPLTIRRDRQNRALRETIAEDAGKMFKADTVALYPYPGDDAAAMPVFWSGGSFRDRETVPETSQQSEAPRQIAERRRFLYEGDIGKQRAERSSADAQLMEPFLSYGEGVVAFATGPLIEPAEDRPGGAGDVVGVICIGYRTPHPFSPSQKLAIEAFASYAALAIHSANGIARLMRVREQVLKESRDDVAHRLGNVLLPIPGAIQLALHYIEKGEMPPEDVSAGLGPALEEARRAQRVVAELERLTSSGPPLSKTKITSQHLLSAFQQVVSRELRDGGTVSATSHLPSPVMLDVNLDDLGDAFRNFAVDSLRVTRANGGLRVTLQIAEMPLPEAAGSSRDQRYVAVIYTDNGPGIPEPEKEAVFTRLYTTSNGMSKGVGLTLAKQDVEKHGGYIRECGRPGEGVRFEMYLPIVSA